MNTTQNFVLTNEEKAIIESMQEVFKTFSADEIVNQLDDISEFVLSHLQQDREVITWNKNFILKMHYTLKIMQKGFLQIERESRSGYVIGQQ